MKNRICGEPRIKKLIAGSNPRFAKKGTTILSISKNKKAALPKIRIENCREIGFIFMVEYLLVYIVDDDQENLLHMNLGFHGPLRVFN